MVLKHLQFYEETHFQKNQIFLGNSFPKKQQQKFKKRKFIYQKALD